MSNFNKVLLMGRLTRDPELRYTPQGTAVSDIGLAVNREFGAGSERRKETVFVDVTAWGRQAEVICEYMKKGSPIFIEGRLSFESWETQDGQKRSKLKVVVENFQFLGTRGESGGGSGGGYSQGGAGADAGGRGADSGAPMGSSSRFSRPASEGVPSAAPAEPEGESLGIDESDIPF